MGEISDRAHIDGTFLRSSLLYLSINCSENQFVGSATYPAIIKIDMAERMFSILSGKSDLTQAKMNEFLQKKGNQTFYQIPDILNDQMMIDDHIETRDFIEMELPQDEDEEEEFEKLLIDHDEL